MSDRGHSRKRLAVSLAAVVVLLSGCAGTADQSTPSSPPASTAGTDHPTTAPSISSEIVGYWHRAQSCADLLEAFEVAGLAQSHRAWLQGNFYGGAEGPDSGDLCAGAEGPLEHSHWFTKTGEFGSHDETGKQVDNGDFSLVDHDTLSFPSHSTGSGYTDDILVDFTVEDGVATFHVKMPDSCDAPCQEAHAWALSAFASGPWATGDVP